ncbi:hypothetical protein BC826DRAFT_353330 [Russula brevipes]|nr:hypothetical protein BC826DRAFT_353330 [Russula brevipes]
MCQCGFPWIRRSRMNVAYMWTSTTPGTRCVLWKMARPAQSRPSCLTLPGATFGPRNVVCLLAGSLRLRRQGLEARPRGLLNELTWCTGSLRFIEAVCTLAPTPIPDYARTTSQLPVNRALHYAYQATAYFPSVELSAARAHRTQSSRLQLRPFPRVQGCGRPSGCPERRRARQTF